eukprot:9220098-Heterocapsa_arctica.AAC.1
MAVRYSSRPLIANYQIQVMPIQWLDDLWTHFDEALKLQIDVCSNDCRRVMTAPLQSQDLTVAE